MWAGSCLFLACISLTPVRMLEKRTPDSDAGASGGIMKCDVIAQGIVNAAAGLKLQVPLVVRLEGTNVERGKEILRSSGMEITTADDLDDAASKAVKAIA